ncbi:molybdopterin cofactor-binding domain-containing protein [Caldimonas sp. KR1-144]|uniref:xanthine dehydrogenase family protein molybdopterin-binding subunit n=1 Tax=Caldimonas sp. KR1-144 TaxID=3400911 RepID=UPI003C10A241
MTRRRHFLLGAAGVGGALVVGWGLLPPRERLGQRRRLPVERGEVALNGWLKISADGRVRLAMPRTEMGQGVHHALALLVAEELDVEPAQIDLVDAGPESIYGNPTSITTTMLAHPGEAALREAGSVERVSLWLLAKAGRELGMSITGGSSSVADAWDVLPLVAATARAQLIGAASLAWKLPADELRIELGVVHHGGGGRHAHFGELAALAAGTRPATVARKPREQWRLIGKAVPRRDVPAKVDGSAVFGIDVRPDGLLYAAVCHAPSFGGSLGRLDADALRARPGVLRVVRLLPLAGAAHGIAIVARSSWHALEAARAAAQDPRLAEWRPAPRPEADSAAILDDLAARAERAARDGDAPAWFRDDGDAPGALARAQAAGQRVLEAHYRAPYLAHAPLEPIGCTAQVKDGRVTLWVSTQVPSAARTIAARVAGVGSDAVTVHVPYVGGGFGRRLEVDMVGQAVSVALECAGAPVQLIWPRDEDLGHDFYRPAAAATLRAALDADGRPQAIAIAVAGDAITPRNVERTMPLLAGPIDLPDKTAVEGLHSLPYAVPNVRVAHVATRSGVPIGYWRSVGHSHHAFFAESFVDELAQAAGQDPLRFRLELLAERPLYAAVLRLAAQKAGWPGFGAAAALPAGRARGVALHESYGSVVAQVVEASIESGVPRVHRVVCAADCGSVVSPDGVAQQLEGGIVWALGAALRGRCDIEAGRVRQRDLASLGLLTLAETPRIEVHLVPSTRAPGGVGEIAVPPLAPALANALAALGPRRRTLPLIG